MRISLSRSCGPSSRTWNRIQLFVALNGEGKVHTHLVLISGAVERKEA
jgi:hypothetical protein